MPCLCASCRSSIGELSDVCPECGDDPRLDGRYALIEVLGGGSIRTTYRAVRIADGQAVAVKELPYRRIDAFKTEALFRREIDILAQLDHPAIPKLIEGFTTEDRKRGALVLVRELVEGSSLADETSARRHTPREVAVIAAELCDVLAYLHARTPPVIHRDLTPSNVVRASDGRLALVDFGSVKEAATPEGSTIGGTFGAMAPEQLRGVAVPASDLYAIGALIASLCAGRPAHALVDRRYRIAVDDVPAGRLRRLVARLLAPEPSERPRSAARVARALRAIASRPEPSPSLRVGRWSAIAAIGGLALAALTVGSTTLVASKAADPKVSAPLAIDSPVHAPPPSPPSPPPIPSRSWPLAPAPPPDPDWRPACGDDCMRVTESFAGVRLERACASLVPDGRRAPAESRTGRPTELELGELTLTCEASQQHGSFCNLHCTATVPDGWQAASALVRWIGDRYGAYARSHEQLHPRWFAAGPFGERSYTWEHGGFGAPEVLVQGRHVEGGRDTVVVSYRGRMGRPS